VGSGRNSPGAKTGRPIEHLEILHRGMGKSVKGQLHRRKGERRVEEGRESALMICGRGGKLGRRPLKTHIGQTESVAPEGEGHGESYTLARLH